jgi:hypothetical protein
VIAEALLGFLRLAHALSAATWVGLAVVWVFWPQSVVVPAGSAWPRDIVRSSIGVFVVTGTIMAMERLSTAQLPALYVALLGVKVVLGLWMFTITRRLGAGRVVPGPRPEVLILALGVVIYALAVTLRMVHESVLRSASI